MAKMIDGKTYNKITALCDQLVELNNKLAERDDITIMWDVTCDGIFSMSIGVFHGDKPRLEGTAMWFFRDDRDGKEYNAMIDKINEWEKTYASA